MSVLSFILGHKLLVFFILATTALAISTIVLGVDNTDLRSQLENKNKVIPTTAPPPVTTTTPAPPPSTPPPIDMSKYRLPTSVIPINYDLYLYPNLQTGLFRGQVITTANIQENVVDVVMHSHLLTITSVSIDGAPANFEVDADFERLTVRKADNSELTANTNVSITIDYEGDMKNRIVGLYTSSYLDATTLLQKRIATSKFEPTYARQAFPCFDEPNLKATYKVHLLKPNDADYIALSNYPQNAEEPGPDGTMVHFDETVPMSTYLSCFIVSDFQNRETEFENDGALTKLRVYASPAQLDKTTYAGQVGKSTIEFYINYFNISYPLPKLDMVAIPDFVSGAMEHWGLVTFRETALLYNESTHSSANQQRVAEVVAHELAHSWFGNLVTMDWWNNLWLNEGFASYIQYKGVQASHPDWGMMDQFLIGDLHAVLSLDATQGSHPIIQTVQTPDQITEVFDTISYNKGASVLRMLENVVGAENFQKGVTDYLVEYKYNNAVTQDLWDKIQAVVGNSLNVTNFMNTFTVQMGYPILNVQVNGNSYTFTQKRFLKDPTSTGTATSPFDYKWSVPIRYITDLDANESEIHWFDYTENSITIEKPAGAAWIKFNPSQIGYYRVNYPENDWRNLQRVITDLSISDRSSLLEESFSIAESGDLSYGMALDLTKYLVNETDYVPWSVASSRLQSIRAYLQNSQSLSLLQKYVIGILKPAYDQYGWDETSTDGHLEKLTRLVVLNLACAMDDPSALSEAGSRFAEWISANEADRIDILPNLRATIYKYGMVNADEATWEKLFQIFVAENDASEKIKLMNGLANVRNPTILTRLIDLAKDETYIRSQDYFTLLQYISANPIGSPIVWDYVRENWEQLVSRFTLNDRYLGRLIPGISSSFSTNVKLEEMQAFFTKFSNAGAGAAARVQAAETVTNNIKWLATHKTIVETWLNENGI